MMAGLLTSNNCFFKLIVLVIQSIFIAISDILGYARDSILNRKAVLIIRLFPASIMSIIICFLIGQISSKYTHYLMIIFLSVIFLFTALFIILYHALKEPEDSLNIIPVM